MKKQLFGFLFVISLVAGVSAQKAQTATSLEANLRKHIEYLASDKLEGRRAGEPGAVLAGNYVAEQFKKIGLRPGFTGNGKPDFKQPFSYTPVRDPHSAPVDPTAGSQEKNTFNVIGILSGHDPVLKNEAIVIGAHYDHLGHGGSGSLAANSTEVHHGADDNASGTAAVIELARMFAGQKSNKRTLIFIAFSGEEDGVFGSKYYVNNPAFPLDKTVAMINLDMVGRLNENKLNIGGIGTATEWKEKVGSLNSFIQESKTSTETFGPIVKATASAKEVSLFALQLNEDGFGPSDHSSFYGKQIPVLFFFTGTHLDYHKPSDTADKINYSGEANLINYVASIAKSVDENRTRPTYAVAKSSNTGGRTTFSISLGTIPSYADSTDGMELDGVRDGSPAAKAGLKKGDKVIKLAGKDVKNVYDYTDAMSGMKPDIEYEVVITRSGETLTLKIIPAAARR